MIPLHFGESVLKGNAIALIQLAEFIVSIALKDICGSHIHLNEDNFFDIADKELVITKWSKDLEKD